MTFNRKSFARISVPVSTCHIIATLGQKLKGNLKLEHTANRY